MTYYVFSFATRSAALAFYDALDGVTAREIVSTPVRLTSSCGLSVSVTDYDKAVAVLRRASYGNVSAYYYDGKYTRIR